MTLTLRRITAVVLLVLLSACGFHLRGKGDTAGFAYPLVYVEGGGGSAEQLRSYLPLLDGVKLSKKRRWKTRRPRSSLPVRRSTTSC